ncbi:NAD-dependent epimerase/dehydratase family protein [Alphaproteobacteria bacterium]|nr:NAD-dependent epimerase/dehydratase family protein [Alphaproteobacteria bacterium]
MKHFVVTGGCGFIGSNLCKFLNKKGCKVTVIDNLSVGKYENISNVKNLDFFHSNIEDFDFYKLKDLSGFFHLAAQTNITYSLSNFYKSSKINVNDSLKVIDFCSLNKIKLVYASSSAVYGNLLNGIEGDKIDLINPYAVDKYLMEQYCAMSLKTRNLSSYGLRFFNVYGPGQDGNNPYSGVISIFIENLLNNRDIYIFGGKQVRDFIFVDDIIKGLWSAYLYLDGNNKSSISNVLTGKSTSISDILKLIVKKVKEKPKIHYKDYITGDAMSSSGSLVKMKNELKIENLVDIGYGLELTINWYKKKLNNWNNN